MDDVLAVMEVAGSRRAGMFGTSAGGPMSALFAATYPERAVSLIPHGSFARITAAPDYPEGLPRRR